MLSKEQVYKVIDTVIDQTKGHNTLVIVQNQVQGLTRFANSEIHQNVYEDTTEVTIVVSEQNKRSEIKTNLFTEPGLRAAAQEALANLEFLPEGDEQPLPIALPLELLTDNFNSALEAGYDVEKRALLVKECLDTLSSEYMAFGALTYAVSQLAVGNSRGIKRLALTNSVSFSAIIASPSGGSGYAEILSSRPEDFDVPATFRIAYDKARLNQNPVEIEPGAYTVILEPLAVGDLLTYLSYLGFSGKSVQNQISFMTGKLGEKIFGENITIVDDCTDENTVQLPFDFEGTPRQKVTIIENGVAKALTYDQASATIAGVESTGHSVNMPAYGGIPLNLVMAGGDQSLEEIIANTDKGLLVTRFHYMNPVNPRAAQLTALTRDGLFIIEAGKITGAAKNMRFTESMLQAFNNVDAVSCGRKRTSFFFGNYYVPALKVTNFHFTGKAN